MGFFRLAAGAAGQPARTRPAPRAQRSPLRLAGAAAPLAAPDEASFTHF
jgi:methyl-accepting chemotaxis protein